MDLFCPGVYENPLSPSGRGRTIAAFLVAQGSNESLSQSEMRRDVLNCLMSIKAVSYWLNMQRWLEPARKLGRVQLVRLTDSGYAVCQNSLAGGSNVPTDIALVRHWVDRMLHGGTGAIKKTFVPLRGI